MNTEEHVWKDNLNVKPKKDHYVKVDQLLICIFLRGSKCLKTSGSHDRSTEPSRVFIWRMCGACRGIQTREVIPTACEPWRPGGVCVCHSGTISDSFSRIVHRYQSSDSDTCCCEESNCQVEHTDECNSSYRATRSYAALADVLYFFFKKREQINYLIVVMGRNF